MTPLAYEDMDRMEGTHWWFAGRRSIVQNLISNLSLPEHPRILEVGCGTGGNLEMLSSFGCICAFDMNDTACALARSKSANTDIRTGHCPEAIPFAGDNFQLICMFDVLEHIEDDIATLCALRSRLASNGRIVLTVPAHPCLWSRHDEFLHHHRRYQKTELIRKLKTAGYAIDRMTYFNTLLFPLGAITRLIAHKGNRPVVGTTMPPAWINQCLRTIFSSEGLWLRHGGDFPIGMSLLAIAHVG